MNTATAAALPPPSEHTSQEAPNSNITALPTPSPEQILRDQIATLTTERDAATARCKSLEVDVAERTVAIVDMRARLKAIEENSLSFALANLDAGGVLIDAGEKLQSLAAIVRKREAKGTFKLTITVKPFKGEALVFVPCVSITEPKPEPAQSVFYASEDGELSRNDPRQKEFDGFGSREDRAEAHERAHPELR